MRARFLLWIAVLGLASCHKVEESLSGASNPPITTHNLRGLWGSGPNDVWAAGDKGTILHFDGKAWKVSPSGTDEDLTGITGTGPTNVYVSGQKGGILHWDGQGWSQVSGGEETTLSQIWASGPDDIWAVGIDNDSEGAYLRRWTGGKWETQGIPGASSLWGVNGTGPTDVWMAGNTPKGGGVRHSRRREALRCQRLQGIARTRRVVRGSQRRVGRPGHGASPALEWNGMGRAGDARWALVSPGRQRARRRLGGGHERPHGAPPRGRMDDAFDGDEPDHLVGVESEPRSCLGRRQQRHPAQLERNGLDPLRRSAPRGAQRRGFRARIV